MKLSWTHEQRARVERAYAERRALYVGLAPEQNPWVKKIDELEVAFWEETRRTPGETKPRATLRRLLEFLSGEYPSGLFRECEERLAKKKLTPDQRCELRLGVITRIDRLDSLVDTLRCYVESAQIVEMILRDVVSLLARESRLANLLRPNFFEHASASERAEEARLAKSEKWGDLTREAREKAVELIKVSPVYSKTPTKLAREMERRGKTGEVGGISGIKRSTLRGYISDLCGSKSKPHA
jgi:hypothetical protein